MPLFIILMLIAMSGCQLLGGSNSNKIESYTDKVELITDKANFSHYYLWIKNLNEEEIAEEIIQQKSNKESGDAQADVQLIMLYSLPISPIHNPYTAKTRLNDYPLAPHVETTFSDTDLAFIIMLKDQLNQQLLLLEQLTNYKGAYQQSKKVNSEQQLKIDELNKQIIQLKKIEKTISNRGQ
ncbi:MAG: hypothetical protein QNK36_22305 [Colwellia sp.]|nr:hypothetical protein [Colwellia sp.]